MKKYVIIGMGSPSDVKAFEKSYDSLGGTISSYLDRKGLLHTQQPVIVSCHRTLKRVVSYALETELHADHEERRVVVILFGGLSLALPGIFSSETTTLPVIGVPALASGVHGGGIDAATAVYNLPPGTVVAGVPVHSEKNPSLDKAILIAEKILDATNPKVAIVSEKDTKQLQKAKSTAGVFDMKYNHMKDVSKDLPEITLHIAEDNYYLKSCDDAATIALQCIAPKEDSYSDFTSTLEELDKTKNTLYFSNAVNATLFVARVMGLSDTTMREQLMTYKKEQEEGILNKYGERIRISEDLFTQGTVTTAEAKTEDPKTENTEKGTAGEKFLTEDEARALAKKHLADTLDKVDITKMAKGVPHHKGKVRENFVMTGTDGKQKRILVTTDRVSVFDSVVGTIPFKGQVLDEITHWWFDQTKNKVENHIISRPSSTIILADQCIPLKVEMVVRGYLTGTSSTSIWTAYKNGSRVFCGNPLEDGMKQDQPLPVRLLTPSTKADQGDHDVSVSSEEVLSMEVLPGDKTAQKRLMEQLTNHSFALFDHGQALAEDMGLILVDTKYEFGITQDGRVVVIDEIHTPDSSRFWEKATYKDNFEAGKSPKSLSKQFARDAVIAQGYDPEKGGKVPMLEDEARVECAVRYIMLCQRITGKPFVPDTRPLEERIYKPLKVLGVLE
ncbi:phosphoribosylaminoimidazolesuccinocarboxamide synthase [Nanoarchaeota archaeon]